MNQNHPIIVTSAPDIQNQTTDLILQSLENDRHLVHPNSVAIDPQRLPIAIAIAMHDHSDEILREVELPFAPDSMIVRLGLHTWAVTQAELARDIADMTGSKAFEKFRGAFIDFIEAGENNHARERTRMALANPDYQKNEEGNGQKAVKPLTAYKMVHYGFSTDLIREEKWPKHDPAAIIDHRRNHDAETYCVGQVIAMRRELKEAEPLLIMTAGPESVMTSHDWAETPYDHGSNISTLVSRPAERAALAALALAYDLGVAMQLGHDI